MPKYTENIYDNSIWVTSTPTPAALTLPFYIIETGIFTAYKDYNVAREYHDSFLFLYTISGSGTIDTEDNEFILSPGFGTIIDCRKPHSYHCNDDDWKFFWMHFKGSSSAPMYDILYHDSICPIKLTERENFEQLSMELVHKAAQSDIISSLEISARIHAIFNKLIHSVIEGEKSTRRKTYSDDIDAVIDFIESNYHDPITVDDMIKQIHISKYHFIRLFRRVIGITPYSYLTNYRINISKQMLRSSDSSISEIAESCGFSDTSNFIAHFKRHTGVRPAQYRKDFGVPK